MWRIAVAIAVLSVAEASAQGRDIAVVGTPTPFLSDIYDALPEAFDRQGLSRPNQFFFFDSQYDCGLQLYEIDVAISRGNPILVVAPDCSALELVSYLNSRTSGSSMIVLLPYLSQGDFDAAINSSNQVVVLGASPPEIGDRSGRDSTIQALERKFAFDWPNGASHWGCVASGSAPFGLCGAPESINIGELVDSISLIHSMISDGASGTVPSPFGEIDLQQGASAFVGDSVSLFVDLDRIPTAFGETDRDFLAALAEFCPGCSGGTKYCSSNGCPKECGSSNACTKENGKDCCTVNGMPPPP
jgi:hypothetical protein